MKNRNLYFFVNRIGVFGGEPGKRKNAVKNKIMRSVLLILILLLVLNSCTEYAVSRECDETYIYIYDIQRREKHEVEFFGINLGAVKLHYLNRTNSILFGYGSEITIIYLDDMCTRSIELPKSIWDQGDLDVSPDERYVIFDHNYYGTQGLYLLDLETEESSELFYDDCTFNCVSFSNQGNKLAFTRTTDYKEYSLYIYYINTRQTIRTETSTANIKSIVFSEQDEEMYYLKNGIEIWQYSFITRQKEKLIQDSCLNFSICPLYYQKLLSVEDSLLYYTKFQDLSSDQVDLKIYSYNLVSKHIELVSMGIIPYDKSEKYQLHKPVQNDYRFSVLFQNELILLNKQTNEEIILEKGYLGEISEDNSLVVYLYYDQKYCSYPRE